MKKLIATLIASLAFTSALFADNHAPKPAKAKEKATKEVKAKSTKVDAPSEKMPHNQEKVEQPAEHSPAK